jgi:hypothetical protein
MRWINPVLVGVLVAWGGAGCAGPCDEPARWQAAGETIPEGVEAAVAAARAASPCAVSTFGGTVTFQLLPFIYQGAMVDGWVEQVECDPRMGVTTFGQAVECTSLVHELGHVLWERCGLTSFDRPRNCHRRPFLRWVWEVNRTVASTLGHPAPDPFELPSWACPEGGQVP